LFCVGGAVEAVEDPFEDTAVFAVARPHEVALFVTAEPVDEEDLGEFFFIGFCSYLESILEVVGHVVPAEGEHGHLVKAEPADIKMGIVIQQRANLGTCSRIWPQKNSF
jgi:hypothetical protein